MRQTTRLVAGCCAGMLFGVATAAAQGSATPPAGGGAAAPGWSGKPFARLFAPRTDLEIARRKMDLAVEKLQTARPGSARRFICGTPVLVPDETIDRGIIRLPPATGPAFTMRIVPPLCH